VSVVTTVWALAASRSADISPNRKCGRIITAGDRSPLPHARSCENGVSLGEPEHGANLAEELERLVTLHDASTIAAVIIEPIAGSTGVLIPPKGYLQRIRRKFATVTAFSSFSTRSLPASAERAHRSPRRSLVYTRSPNGGQGPHQTACVPIGAVAGEEAIFEAFLQGPEGAIELFHGYTYSAHPTRVRRRPGNAGHLRA